MSNGPYAWKADNSDPYTIVMDKVLNYEFATQQKISELAVDLKHLAPSTEIVRLEKEITRVEGRIDTEIEKVKRFSQNELHNSDVNNMKGFIRIWATIPPLIVTILAGCSYRVTDLPPKNWSRYNVSIWAVERGKDGEEETYAGAGDQQAERS